MSKFYADKFYRSASGNYFTGEYLKHQFNLDHDKALVEGYTWITWGNGSDWDSFHKELSGQTVTCNYSQIFSADSQRIMCNNISEVHPYLWDYLENGDLDEETDIFQWFIIDDHTADRLKEHTNELIFYWPEADLYILGVTHWGTSWDYVAAEFIY